MFDCRVCFKFFNYPHNPKKGRICVDCHREYIKQFAKNNAKGSYHCQKEYARKARRTVKNIELRRNLPAYIVTLIAIYLKVKT